MKTLGLSGRDDPVYEQKNPYQTALLALCVVASWPLLQGETGSATLERELSEPAVILWGLCLLVGSLIALLGEFWPGRTWTALVIERSGLMLVGLSALIYAVIVWTSVGGAGADAAFIVSLTFGWGLACLWKSWQNTVRLRWMRGLLKELGKDS